jgi:hypothetical protein
MYVLTQNGLAKKFPYSVGDLGKDFPHVSFPRDLNAETLSGFGIFPVVDNQPTYDANTQTVAREGCAYSVERGRWEAVWTTRSLSAEEINARKAKARAAMQLSFAQMLIGLVTEAWITEAEGEAWLTGAVPAAVSALIGTLPANQRFAAKARAVRPSVVLRTDPLVIALATMQGKAAEELDAFFTTYAQV